MADISPFRGIIYNPEMIKDLSLVIAPPYDVISVKARPSYYAKHPQNVIRLELGDESAQGETGPDRYRRVPEYLKEWEKRGILIRENEPAFYLYQVEFPIRGEEMRIRKGFIGLCRLEEFGKGMVFPHERIHEEQKEDRIMILRTSQANISPIFSLYSDPERSVDALFKQWLSTPPLFDFHGEDLTHHQLWSVKDRDILRSVCNSMKTKKLFIADGHHRYQAAMAYKKEVEKSFPSMTGKETFNYVLMFFCAFEDEGLTILPSHRLVLVPAGFDRPAFETRLSEYFLKKEYPFDAGNEPVRRAEFLEALEREGERENAFGLYIQGNDYYTLLLRQKESESSPLSGMNIPAVLQRLDVVILHRFILEQLLGIEEKDQDLSRIQIIKNANHALDLVREGRFQIAFLMNPPRIGEVQAVASRGEYMPQKSTFFYPKLPTGLVINRIISGETTNGLVP